MTPTHPTTQAAAAALLALAVHGAGWAAGTDLLAGPVQERHVEEYRQSDGSLLQDGVAFDASSVRIELGQPGSGRFAQAYSSFDRSRQTSTYWVSVDDYPGIALAPAGTFFDNGVSVARVVQHWRLRKDAADATLALRVTGGRLRLQEYVHSGAAHLAEVGLQWWVSTSSVDVSRADLSALLGGYGGTLGGSETFDHQVRGFRLDADSYRENTSHPGSLNVVEAVLDIPAQEVPIDIGAIIPFNASGTSDGEFTLTIVMAANALAMDPERGAAQAFLRDPVAMGQADPLLGANGLSFTGLTVLPAVPEPQTWALLLAGCGLLARVARRRAAPAH